MRFTPRRVLLAVVAAILVGLGAFAFMLYKDRTVVGSPPYVRAGSGPANAVVIFHSRTGTTEAAAKAVARYLDADLVRIDAPRYTRDFNGWRAAAEDARAEVTETPISHPPIDLSRYDVVALGSPIWIFRPTPALWTFAGQNDLTGRQVLLFNVGNSRFEQENIDLFQTRVEAQGGTWLGHLFIRRGRVYAQKNVAEIQDEVRAALTTMLPAATSQADSYDVEGAGLIVQE